MPGALLPPYADPSGPELPPDALVDGFLEGSRSGFSADLHIEGDTLLAQRGFALGARLGSRMMLVRVDIPEDVVRRKSWLEEHLLSRGLAVLEPDARLGDVAAIQVTGIRGGVWDLWGVDAAEARQALEQAVLGPDASPAAMRVTFSEGPEIDSGVGMTLEDLIGESGVPPEEER